MRKLPYKRLWCSTCKEYKLFDRKKFMEVELYCDTCDSLYVETELSEIPEKKIVKQRERYKQVKRNRSLGLYNAFLTGNGLQLLMNESDDIEIIEDDAGQREIDLEIRRKQDIEREKRREQRVKELEEYEKYRNLGRNEKCICGSDKKYKKCCWVRISKIK